ncbi:MAG TPA: hypothetical protein VMF08_22790 [Candidatus Sulfotelmatobacter sp.]|nr:hypothetical protein [Candidatus Sulfotelmatobacter sp.]
MFTLHLENEGRSARVGLSSPMAEKNAAPLEQVTSAGKVKRVQALNGQNFMASANSAQLIEGDPELDFQLAGRLMRDATAVYLDTRSAQPAIATEFKEVEVVYAPDGQEKERRSRVFRTANVDTTQPLKIVRRMPVKECLTKFVFRGMQQLVHTDGLTFDFLHGLAKSLQESQSMALVGAGPKGAGPLVLRDGGTPFRGFLYGEVEGKGDDARYRLLLLLSDQELKRPAAPASAT